jgi:uncharacterized protein (TIGR03382 family)
VALAFAGAVLAAATVDPSAATIEVNYLDAQGAPSAIPRATIVSTLSPQGLVIATDGTQFLVVWAAKAPHSYGIFASRVGTDGQLHDAAPLTLFTPPDTGEVQSDARPSVIFDGQQFVVAFSRLNAISGGDLVQIRVGRDGTVGTLTTLADTDEDETEAALAGDTPGRLFAAWRVHDATLKTPRVATGFWASVPEGFPCTDNNECAAGKCIEGVCCLDPNSCAPFDAGTGGGAQDPGRYRIGCGCSSGAGLSTFALLALALRRRRTTRESFARGSSPPTTGR